MRIRYRFSFLLALLILFVLLLTGTAVADDSVLWTEDSYNVGPNQTTSAGIDFSIENFDDDWYDYRVDVYNPNGNLVDLINISSAESSLVTYFDNNNKPGTYTAKLQKISYTVQGQSIETLATDSTQLNADTPTADVGFDSDTYLPGNDATIYYNVPENSKLVVQGVNENNGEITYQNVWTKSGSGSITVDIPSDTPATSYGASVIYDGQNLADDYAAILSSASEVKLSGKVKDGRTGAVINDAEVTITGKTVHTSPDGRYQITIEPSTSHSITVSKSGYNTKSYSDVSITSDTVRNFYLVPTSDKDGFMLHGTVTDFEDSDKIQGAEITLKNDTKVLKTDTNNQGYYVFYGLKNSSSYILKADKDNYDSHVTELTISQHESVHDFSMNPDAGQTVRNDKQQDASTTLAEFYEFLPWVIPLVLILLVFSAIKKGV